MKCVDSVQIGLFIEARRKVVKWTPGISSMTRKDVCKDIKELKRKRGLQ